jgi:hypothetical protein
VTAAWRELTNVARRERLRHGEATLLSG